MSRDVIDEEITAPLISYDMYVAPLLPCSLLRCPFSNSFADIVYFLISIRIVHVILVTCEWN